MQTTSLASETKTLRPLPSVTALLSKDSQAPSGSNYARQLRRGGQLLAGPYSDKSQCDRVLVGGSLGFRKDLLQWVYFVPFVVSV